MFCACHCTRSDAKDVGRWSMAGCSGTLWRIVAIMGCCCGGCTWTGMACGREGTTQGWWFCIRCCIWDCSAFWFCNIWLRHVWIAVNCCCWFIISCCWCCTTILFWLWTNWKACCTAPFSVCNPVVLLPVSCCWTSWWACYAHIGYHDGIMLCKRTDTWWLGKSCIQYILSWTTTLAKNGRSWNRKLEAASEESPMRGSWCCKIHYFLQGKTKVASFSLSESLPGIAARCSKGQRQHPWIEVSFFLSKHSTYY